MRPRTAVLAAAGVGAGAAALVAVAQAAPALTTLSLVRQVFTPRLAGIGARGHVALTFDDGPDVASTPAFLDALDAIGWKATFFMLGDMTRRAPGLAAEVASAGHEIAVHGDVHRNMLRRSPGEIYDDVRRGRDVVAAATGTAPRFFRPPFGMLSGAALRAAGQLDLETVLWTSWGRDWRPEATPESVTEDVLRGRIDGGTVLLHDSDCTSSPGSWHSAVGALPRLAEAFTLRGLQVGTVAEHALPRQGRV